MSTTVTYKGETLTTVNNTTKTLETKGTWLEDDIELTDVSGGGSTLITKNISANGTYNASSDSADGYSQVTVSVPASAVDTGTKQITANGNGQDVVGYASVDVAVPNSYSAGDEGKVVDNGALVAQTAHADVTPTTSDQTIDTTLNNSLKVKGDANLVAGNIKKDVEIFGTTGSYEGGGGGSGLTTIASGTFVGNDNSDQNIPGRQQFSIGTKMAKTDFYVLVTANDGANIDKDTNRKFVWLYYQCDSSMGGFDLSTDGNKAFVAGSYHVDSDDSGTITTRNVCDAIRWGKQLYNGSISDVNPGWFQIRKYSDRFDIALGQSNSVYRFTSECTYSWKVVYYGSNPSTDIVEIS